MKWRIVGTGAKTFRSMGLKWLCGSFLALAGMACGTDTLSPGQTSTSVATQAEKVHDLNEFIAFSSDNTQSPNLPLGTRFQAAAARNPNSDELAFLADPTRNPPIPTSGSNSDLAYQNFNVTLYPSGTGQPSPIDIMQHAVADTDLDAAFAALAYAYPDFVKSRIQALSPNTWAVAVFTPSGQRATIKVNNQFVATSDKMLAGVSGRKYTANWATVLEKAVMKYNLVYRVIQSYGVGNIGGMGSEHTIPIFVGSGLSYAFQRGILTASQLRQQVINALGHGMLVTGGFGQQISIDGYRTEAPHAYTVLPPKDDQTMLSVRSPWGVALNVTTGQYDALKDGVLNAPNASDIAQQVDLRVIDTGIAGHTSNLTPYVPATVP